MIAESDMGCVWLLPFTFEARVVLAGVVFILAYPCPVACGAVVGLGRGGVPSSHVSLRGLAE